MKWYSISLISFAILSLLTWVRELIEYHNLLLRERPVDARDKKRAIATSMFLIVISFMFYMMTK